MITRLSRGRLKGLRPFKKSSFLSFEGEGFTLKGSP